MAFDCVSRTHVGLKRKINEDALMTRTERGLWAVADGMVTSVLVTAARMSVLRTFFNIFPFAVRAPKQAHAGGLKVFG